MRRMKMRAPLAAVLVALLAGCGASMPSLNPMEWFAKPSGPKPAELPALTTPQAVKQLWSASIGGAESFVLAPALVGDSLYVAARDGSVARLEAATGKAI